MVRKVQGSNPRCLTHAIPQVEVIFILVSKKKKTITAQMF